MIRMNKYLASAGIGSRRKCDEYIIDGKVSVNGQVEKKLGVRVDELKDIIFFEGNEVKIEKNLLYIILNKPIDIITSAKDEFGGRRRGAAGYPRHRRLLSDARARAPRPRRPRRPAVDHLVR